MGACLRKPCSVESGTQRSKQSATRNSSIEFPRVLGTEAGSDHSAREENGRPTGSKEPPVRRDAVSLETADAGQDSKFASSARFSD